MYVHECGWICVYIYVDRGLNVHSVLFVLISQNSQYREVIQYFKAFDSSSLGWSINIRNSLLRYIKI